ncbi:VOC family protein [Paenibacillus sp. NEAU-GSW1]|uniref:VOC family protein n=1 Tax=Paenibacillus sp. NEAU-GSW1 TaxID=2682486 RepID=UPI0012E102E3|nr:VOC family protein [Paenibacillus sp. NEAU-GSW1]MUT65948.1 VOC family protein [Paenibacillus sp. NEAU-GSW1]
MRKIVSKISGIFIPVTDLQRSTEWYIRIFDLEVIERSEMYTGLAFPGEVTSIGLWKVEKPQPIHFDTGTFKVPYYNFESFDIEYSHAALIEKGVDVQEIEIHEEETRFFDFHDPDGNLLGIVEELPGSAAFYAHKQKYRRD